MYLRLILKLLQIQKISITTPEGQAHMTVGRLGLSKSTELKVINSISVWRKDTGWMWSTLRKGRNDCGQCTLNFNSYLIQLPYKNLTENLIKNTSEKSGVKWKETGCMSVNKWWWRERENCLDEGVSAHMGMWKSLSSESLLCQAEFQFLICDWSRRWSKFVASTVLAILPVHI